jgi:hypothetical protein
VPAGAHVYTVHAEDAAGDRSAGSAPHLVAVPRSARRGLVRGDRTAPRVRLLPIRRAGGRLLIAARARVPR